MENSPRSEYDKSRWLMPFANAYLGCPSGPRGPLDDWWAAALAIASADLMLFGSFVMAERMSTEEREPGRCRGPAFLWSIVPRSPFSHDCTQVGGYVLEMEGRENGGCQILRTLMARMERLDGGRTLLIR